MPAGMTRRQSIVFSGNGKHRTGVYCYIAAECGRKVQIIILNINIVFTQKFAEFFRSINLANSVSIALYEAMRQTRSIWDK